MSHNFFFHFFRSFYPKLWCNFFSFFHSFALCLKILIFLIYRESFLPVLCCFLCCPLFLTPLFGLPLAFIYLAKKKEEKNFVQCFSLSFQTWENIFHFFVFVQKIKENRKKFHAFIFIALPCFLFGLHTASNSIFASSEENRREIEEIVNTVSLSWLV